MDIDSYIDYMIWAGRNLGVCRLKAVAFLDLLVLDFDWLSNGLGVNTA